MSDIVFMDTETLGLDIASPIWEFAAVRRYEDGTEGQLHLHIRHHATPWLADFPEEFARDYHARYSDRDSVSQLRAAELIVAFMAGRPHIVGAVPSFDTERIAHQLLRPNRIREPWHYHLIDIENVVVGYLRGERRVGIDDGMPEHIGNSIGRLTSLPWSSDHLSNAVGVNPDDFERHTAMGDVRWVMAQWDAVMGA